MTKQLESPLYEKIEASFDITSLRSNNPSLLKLRQDAYAEFVRLGFPSLKHEEWKYANLLPLVKEHYVIDENPNQSLHQERIQKTAKLLAQHWQDLLQSTSHQPASSYLLVTINGSLCPELSDVPPANIVKITPLDDADNEVSFQKYFGKIATIKENAMAALNTALHSAGYLLEVKEKSILDKPIHIVNVILADENVMLNPRHLFVINKGSKAEIIETEIAELSNNAKALVNGLIEIYVDRTAELHHYDVQKGCAAVSKIQRTESVQEKHSNYSNYTFTLPGNDFLRNNLSMHLNDSEIESHLYGLCLTADKQFADNHTEVHHKMPHCESNQLYKGVLFDSSKAVFNGKIFVYQDAQKTNAFQQSNNVLFGDKATVYAKPQLEIYADDVKCSHGTTIGQMDKDALFYLQSRGISEQTAKVMLVKAFANDVVQKIKIPFLQHYLEQAVGQEMER